MLGLYAFTAGEGGAAGAPPFGTGRDIFRFRCLALRVSVLEVRLSAELGATGEPLGGEM